MSDELSRRLDAWGRSEIGALSREVHMRSDGAFLRSVRRARRVRAGARVAAACGVVLLLAGLASWAVISSAEKPAPVRAPMPEPTPRAIDR